MPKLLTWTEAVKLAKSVCKEYGLPAPEFGETEYSYGDAPYIRISVRSYGPPGRFGCKTFRSEGRVEAPTLEEAVHKLENHLQQNYGNRAQLAELLRSKYSMKEADEFLDKELRK